MVVYVGAAGAASFALWGLWNPMWRVWIGLGWMCKEHMGTPSVETRDQMVKQKS